MAGGQVYWYPHRLTARVAADGLVETVDAALRGEYSRHYAAFVRHLLNNPDVSRAAAPITD